MGPLLGVGRGAWGTGSERRSARGRQPLNKALPSRIQVAPRATQAPAHCRLMQHKSEPRNHATPAAGLPQRNTRATTLGWLWPVIACNQVTTAAPPAPTASAGALTLPSATSSSVTDESVGVLPLATA